MTAGQAYCPSCGLEVNADPVVTIRCQACGNTSTHTGKFCPECGTRVATVRASEAATQPSAKQMVLTLLSESGEVLDTIPLQKNDVTLGREGADVCFEEDSFLSPVHAQLTIVGETIELRDLGSRNGTWYFIDEPQRLQDGGRIMIGSQIVTFRKLGYPGPRPPELDLTRRLGSLTPQADIATLTQLRGDGS